MWQCLEIGHPKQTEAFLCSYARKTHKKGGHPVLLEFDPWDLWDLGHEGGGDCAEYFLRFVSWVSEQVTHGDSWSITFAYLHQKHQIQWILALELVVVNFIGLVETYSEAELSL